jgi:hypothetical protein
VNRRDARIGRLARLYRLLADRDEYMSRDLEQRLAATSARRVPHMSGVDAESIENVGEIDRVCGAAVRRLRKRADAGVVDVLGWVDPDRLAAVALALPEGRRRAVLGRDYAWTRAFGGINHDAIREVETLIADFDAVGERLDDALRQLGGDPEAFADDARRAMLGLPLQ